MGNRAVITLDSKPTKDSVGIYLHWNGGPESVLAFAEAAQHFGIRFNDDSYGIARLAQIIGNWIGGTLSIGVGRLAELDCNNYDNGTFKVTLTDAGVVLEQSKDGNAPWTRLDNDEIRRHPYWTNEDGEGQMLAEVIEANRGAFGKGMSDDTAPATGNRVAEAAPELLAALRGLLQHFDGPQCLAADYPGSFYMAELEAAKSAMKKAGVAV